MYAKVRILVHKLQRWGFQVLGKYNYGVLKLSKRLVDIHQKMREVYDFKYFKNQCSKNKRKKQTKTKGSVVMKEK